MANHGYVTTRRTIRPQLIHQLLARLNRDKFGGNLTIDYELDTWTIRYNSPVDGQQYADRTCWLRSSRSFEMKHGGGGDFAWWLDTYIMNEVAVAVQGTITDDADQTRDPGISDKFPRYVDYANMLCSHHGNSQLLQLHRQLIWEITPPEYQSELVAEWGPMARADTTAIPPPPPPG